MYTMWTSPRTMPLSSLPPAAKRTEIKLVCAFYISPSTHLLLLLTNKIQINKESSCGVPRAQHSHFVDSATKMRIKLQSLPLTFIPN